MKITQEQQDSLNKARCKQLKDIRRNMAIELGISLNQSECQNKEYCSGTCKKCKEEEKLLNDAIEKQQHKVKSWKKKTMVANLLVATTLTMSSCTPNNNDNITISGDVQWSEEDENQTSSIYQEDGTNASITTEDFGN